MESKSEEEVVDYLEQTELEYFGELLTEFSLATILTQIQNSLPALTVVANLP